MSVRYPCATGRIGEIGEPSVDGERASVTVQIVRVSEDEPVTRVHARATCPGSATSFPSITCVATLERTAGAWTFGGWDDPARCPPRSPAERAR